MWPFFSLVRSLSKTDMVGARPIVMAFCAFFGYVYVIFDETFDADRYKSLLEEYHRSDIGFGTILGGYLSDHTDLFQVIVTYVVSRFTDNVNVLLAIFGLLFGIFFSKNLVLISQTNTKHRSGLSWLFIALFVFLIPVWQINGARMWVGVQFFIYCVLSYFFYNSKKHLMLMMLAPLIHFSLAIGLLIFYFYLLFSRFPRMWYWLFIVSFVLTIGISGINLEETSFFLPEAFDRRVDMYSDDTVIERNILQTESTNWYIQYKSKIVQYFVLLSIAIVLFRKRDQGYYNSAHGRFSTFLLVFISITNILLLLNPFLERFLTVYLAFAAALMYSAQPQYYLSGRLSWLYIRVAHVVFIFFIIVQLRVGFDYFGIDLFISNPIIASIVKSDNVLISFFR